MKFWSISFIGCCLLVNGCSVISALHSPSSTPSSSYTTRTDESEVTISWQDHQIMHGGSSNTTVEVSPDGQSVAWIIKHQNGVRHIDSTEDPILEGKLWVAQAGQPPIQIRDTRSSRGWEIDFANYQDEKARWYPEHLQWDSTSQFLYFTTQPWVTRKMLWQARPGHPVPRAIVPLADYRLLKKQEGPDWVEAYETNYVEMPEGRDWHTTYIYTPTELASERYIRPSKTSRITKEWQP